MPNDNISVQSSTQDVDAVIEEDVIQPSPDIVDDNDDLPSDFVSEVQEESEISGRYTPNPSLAAQILASNEKVADDLEKKNKKADINLKWIYGVGILLVLIGWVLFVVLFSWRQLEPCIFKVHHVSDTVFVALLTSATANILALPAIILKYLFPHRT